MENYYWITYKEGKFDIFHERVTYGDFYGRKSNLHSKMYGEREGDETNILQPRFHKKEDAQKVLNIINDIGHKKSFILLKEFPTWFFEIFNRGEKQ